MQEKYGFIYIWRDKKHARFYLGCHWGSEDDRYICSSTWMRNAYKRRPKDFKRRIVARIYTNRTDLLDLEFRWLQLIPSEELGKSYYNLRIVRSGVLPANTNMSERKSRSMKAKMAEKFPIEQRHHPVPKGSDQHINLIKKGVRNYYNNWTDQQRERRSTQSSQQNKGKSRRAGQTNSNEHNLKIAQANGKAVIIDGIEYHSKCAAAKTLGISDGTVNNRIKSDKYPQWQYK